MESVQSVVNIDKFSDWVGIKTKSGRDYFKNKTAIWETDPKKLQYMSARISSFKHTINSDPEFYEKISENLDTVAELETEINTLINPVSNLENEAYQEIIFTRPILHPLNFIPYMLSIWAAARIYILPGLSFMLPLLTILAPYFLLKFIFKLPMTLDNYWKILYSLMSGGGINPNQSTTSSPTTLLKNIGFIGVTFVQSILQPYWTYKHLHSVDMIVRSKGRAVLELNRVYDSLSALLESRGYTFFKSPMPAVRLERDAAARAVLNPLYYKLALKYIGGLEVVVRLAATSEIVPVKWASIGSGPRFELTNVFDYQVPCERRKTFSVNLTGNTHALLTGPNRGGKSTVLRGMVLSAFLAHTYGCSIGTAAVMTPFYNIYVCLKPDDLPGNKSRFEREVEFTAKTLQHPTSPSLVFIDELYHSTNPPDALESCKIYCKQLWRQSNTVSVISTHLFDLVETIAPSSVLRLCCPANINADGSVEFSYELHNGICKVSSVNELLRQNGLISAHTPCDK